MCYVYNWMCFYGIVLLTLIFQALCELFWGTLTSSLEAKGDWVDSKLIVSQFNRSTTDIVPHKSNDFYKG